MARTETAVAVIEQPATGVVEYNLDQFPTATFNRLIPTQTIATTDLLAPVIQVVQLDVERDTYKSPDVPEGCRAINRVGLRKLATAAGISIVDERRTDDGADPNVCEITCLAEMTLPTGQRLRAPGVKRIDIGAQKWASDNQRNKFRSFFQEHVASRAENRAIRALLSLQASYPLGDLAKPFAVVSYAPNMAHPEVRARILDAMAPTVTALYGPEPAKQLAAGEPITDVAPIVDDDEAPGRVVEPDWLSDAGPAQATALSLADAIRGSATDPDAPKGAATKPQMDRLREIFAPIGGAATATGLRALFGDDAVSAPTSAQARAVILAFDSLSGDFPARWAEIVAEATAAA